MENEEARLIAETLQHVFDEDLEKLKKMAIEMGVDDILITPHGGFHLVNVIYNNRCEGKASTVQKLINMVRGIRQ
jgi:hypothetical protein